jgi:hypothetical protein
MRWDKEDIHKKKKKKKGGLDWMRKEDEIIIF